MLILSRHADERIIIDGDIKIKILGIIGKRVSVGIDAPKHVQIHRKEVWLRMKDSQDKMSDCNDEESLMDKEEQEGAIC
jgi:carbon storage regulator